MIEHKLPYTAKQIEDRLEYVGVMIASGIDADLAGYAKTDDIPTKVSEVENDLKFVTQEWLENEYDSNNEPLVVNLSADGTTDKHIIEIVTAWTENRQVIASLGDAVIALTGLRGNSAFFSGVVSAKEVAVVVTGNTYEIIETNLATEQFVQDGYQPKGDYLTAVPEGYAKTSDIPTKPEDIGAQPAGNYALKTEIPNVPVQSVNGKTGAVQLSASDVGALPNTYTPPNQTAEQVGADPKGAAASAVSQHNAAEDSHNDIRLELKAINERLTAFFDSDDKTLDELSEIVTYITNNKTLIDSITTSKVSVADIVNNLTSNVTNKPLSAAQGVALKGLIDGVSNSLANYQPKGDYLTSFTETDPTVPAWAKASSKPSYSKSEVGLGNVDNVKQYSASNPPPYPITSVNGKTGAVTLDAAAVGARPSTWMPSASDVGALPSTYTPPNQTAEQVGADPKGTAVSTVSQHNTANDSHNDIRLELKDINDRLTAFFDSDNQTLDELSEIVAYITNNKSLIDSITTSKVSVADIINNLTTNVTNKPLSAAQGVVLKGLINTLNNNLSNYQPKGDYALASAIPTKVSQLTNDSGFIKSYTETDPTVPSWAKASTKPSYSKSEVGLGNVDNVKQYSSKNPPVVYQSGAPTDTSVIWVDVDDNTVDEFQEAVNAALAQAKASGEFNPVKGTDYWTEEDQESIVQQVITALGTPVFGRVDAEKNIVLSGALAEGTYTVKYEDANGNQTIIGSVAVGDALINMIPLSVGEDGAIYNEVGYKTNMRLSNSTGKESTHDGGFELTGFIPMTVNDVAYGNAGMFLGTKNSYLEICVYKADKSLLAHSVIYNKPETYSTNDDGSWVYTPANGGSSYNDIAYIRVCADVIDENSIITINQPLS